MPTEKHRRLQDLIHRAIDDHELTTSEYHAILELIHDDGVVDTIERASLAEIQDMIADGTIRRVPG